MKRQKILTLLLLSLLTAVLAAALSACAGPKPGPTVSPSASQTVTGTPGEAEPSLAPTADLPTTDPTAPPSAKPTDTPTSVPSPDPTAGPTDAPTTAPTENPTPAPTEAPTASPTEEPTTVPTGAPTVTPTTVPTAEPTQAPTTPPTEEPTAAPSLDPTGSPTVPTPEPTPTVSPKHEAQPSYSHDENGHWRDCTLCDERFDEGEHEWINNGGTKKCTVCDRTRAFTDEENFADFIAARDAAMRYRGAFTYRQSETITRSGDTLYAMSELKESTDQVRYFSIENVYFDPDENGNFQSHNIFRTAIKEVSDNGTTRNKYFDETVTSFGKNLTAAYVAPDYAKEIAFHTPNNTACNYFIQVGDTWEELLQSMYEQYADFYDGAQPYEVFLQRNEDGSVSIVQKFRRSEVEDYVDLDDLEGYLRTEFDIIYILTVQNGAIVSTRDETTTLYVFSDESKNVTEFTVFESSYTYDFDAATHEAFSVDSEETEYWYTGNVYFEIEGHSFRYHYTIPVGDTVSAETLHTYLDTHHSFIIHRQEDSLDGVFSLYTDPEMTEPFASHTFTDENDITVYVKLNVPEKKSIVITLFQYEESQAIQLIYLNNDQEEFRYDDYFQPYVATTRDGKNIAAELGGETSFLCEEGKIHVVLYARF